MTQIASQRGDDLRARQARPEVWGLSARDIHDAFWRSRGVHCVRRGSRTSPSRAADLYLLLEPRQLVLFDLTSAADRLIWRRAIVTRLRVVDQEVDAYTEQVVADEEGWVEKVERRYGGRTRAAYRVILTRRRSIATFWSRSIDRRAVWVQIRRTVARSRLDSYRCPGGCFLEADERQERDLIGRVVALWRDPGRGIDGIHEVAPGIWAAAGETLPKDAVLVSPLWIGHGSMPGPEACLVGPTWLPDSHPGVAAAASKVTVRDIGDVVPSERPPSAAAPKRRSGYATAKRAFDISFGLVVLVLTLPLLAVVALCIVVEDGRPVFYGHRRQSRGGKPFLCWKFRTMSRGPDLLPDELADRNLCDGPQVFIKDDPRVTHVGRVIRTVHIDEFPQFWNVLVGQMSIVGPRPSPDEENQYCPAWRDLRLSVPPGITGLWQLRRTRAPGEDFQEWIKYDLEYVRRASFWLDLSICAQTAWMLLFGRQGR